MKLSHDEVRRIAKLARLSLSDAEVKKFSVQLSDILTHAKMLEEVDTEKVEPAAQITGLKNVTFPDSPVACEYTNELLKQSPQPIQDGMIKVKSVF